jgi:hypothetical protein
MRSIVNTDRTSSLRKNDEKITLPADSSIGFMHPAQPFYEAFCIAKWRDAADISGG